MRETLVIFVDNVELCRAGGAALVKPKDAKVGERRWENISV